MNTKIKWSVLLMCVGALTACQQACQPTHEPVSQTARDGTNTNPDANQVANPDINLKVDLPIHLKHVPVIIHPVVVSAVSRHAEKSVSGEKVTSEVYTNQYYLTGQMFNLVFEDLQTGAHRPLFKNNTQLIHVAHYPVSVLKEGVGQDTTELKADEMKKYGHFLYHVQENLQQTSDERSAKAQLALYMSDETGGQLQKLHPDGQYLTEGRWMADVARYYFTTKSDSDHDGKITLKDNSHNYYVDFKDGASPTVKPYDFMPK